MKRIAFIVVGILIHLGLPLTTTAQEVVINEDFSNGMPSDWIEFKSTPVVSNGVMSLSFGCVILPGEYQRPNGLRIEADVNITWAFAGDFNYYVFWDPFLEGNPFDCNHPSDGYNFGVFPAGSDNTFDWIFRNDLGVPGQPSRVDVPNVVGANEWHRIAAEVLPTGELHLYVDGVLHATLVDAFHTSGPIVLRTWGGVFIDNVRVTVLNRNPVADAGLDIATECAGPGGTEVTLNGLLSSDADGHALSFTWTGPFPEGGGAATGAMPVVTLPKGVSDISLTVFDEGGLSDTDTVQISVVDTLPPTIVGVPALLQVEQEGPLGTPAGAVDFSGVSAFDICDSSPTVVDDAAAVFAPGDTTVTFTATDAQGNAAISQALVRVVDTTPPVVAEVSASPDVLWPPNHKMHDVTISVSSSDAVTAAPFSKIVAVASNESTNATGDGNTSIDWTVTGDLTVRLRAERAGSGNGRLYSITVETMDDAGNTATNVVAVIVPKSQRR